MVLHFFELLKTPVDMSKNNRLLQWLALFKANTEEELKEIEAWGVSELNQAISAYHTVTASPEFRELERLRVKAQHDEAQALHNAGRNARFDIAKNLLTDGDSVEKIIKVTGLTYEEVENLRNTN